MNAKKVFALDHFLHFKYIHSSGFVPTRSGNQAPGAKTDLG